MSMWAADGQDNDSIFHPLLPPHYLLSSSNAYEQYFSTFDRKMSLGLGLLEMMLGNDQNNKMAI